jgi:hypothetical protein
MRLNTHRFGSNETRFDAWCLFGGIASCLALLLLPLIGPARLARWIDVARTRLFRRPQPVRVMVGRTRTWGG